MIVKKRAKKVVNKKIVKRVYKKRITNKVGATPPLKGEVGWGPTKLVLQKHINNPIIIPSEKNVWENKAVFNPAAIMLDNKVHLLYRAMGDADVSVLGHVESEDGENFDVEKRFNIYKHTNPEKKVGKKINYLSGGGGEGGCEDPRLVCVEGIVYLTYTAFNGWDSVRMTISTISENDFKQKKETWSEPIFISPPNGIYKNWVMFPEKINGKFAFLHAISPYVMIDYLDNTNEFKDENYIYGIHSASPLWQLRDKHIRGVGPPPIRTKDGWLILYHGMSVGEMHKYKLFAMLLDLNDPTKILYKGKEPILEPAEHYENGGIKPGIVYSCGAVVKNGDLYVYYGGADNYICLAKANLNEVLEKIKNNSETIIVSQKQLSKIASRGARNNSANTKK